MPLSVATFLQVIWLLNNVWFVYTRSITEIESKSATSRSGIVDETRMGKETRHSHQNDLNRTSSQTYQKFNRSRGAISLSTPNHTETGRELNDVEQLESWGYIPEPTQVDCDDSKSFAFRFDVSVSIEKDGERVIIFLRVSSYESDRSQ